MFHTARFLGERFELDLIAPAAEGVGDARRLLKDRCGEMEFVAPAPGAFRRRLFRLGPYERDPALAAAIGRRLQSGAYGAVHVEKPAMLPYLPRRLRLPIVLDTFAYGLTGGIRALKNEPGLTVQARNLLRLIRSAAFDAFCWPATHCILVVSEVDRQRCLRERPRRKVLVVPNGVDCATIRPGPFRDSGPPILLFTGDMSFDPNVLVAQVLVSYVFPQLRAAHPDAELHLVGRNPDSRVLALRGPGIIVTGEVPDMVPHLHAATLYVAPLATGAGTRTKLLEALAAGLPIVTTSIGIEGIEATDSREVVIADTAEAVAAAALNLLRDPPARRRLGLAARRLAEKRYDWSSCLLPLEHLYSELLPRKAA